MYIIFMAVKVFGVQKRIFCAIEATAKEIFDRIQLVSWKWL
jgi:hypothetical protein